LLRTEIYGELLTITKAKESDEEQPAPNPAPGTPVVPPVVP
jgi:hypothetical protein